jgi:hypothetical protein
MAVGTNQLISTTEMLSITDAAAQALTVLDSYLGTGVGTLTAGYWGDEVLGRVVGKSGTHYGLCDKYKLDNISSGAQSFANSMRSDTFWNSASSALINGLNSNIANYGKYLSTTVTELDSYATYHNSQNDHSMVYHSAFARLYYYWRGKAAMLTAANVLSTTVTFGNGTVVNATTATFTDGAAIVTVSTVSAGVQGCAADHIEFAVTSGTFTGTLTATATDQNGTAAYFSVIASGYTSAGTAIQMTPAVAGKRASDVTAVSYTGNGTAATFQLRSKSRSLI